MDFNSFSNANVAAQAATGGGTQGGTMTAATEGAVGNHAAEAAGAQADDNAGNRRAAAAAYGPFQAMIRRINPSLILKLLALCFMLNQVDILFLFFFSSPSFLFPS